MKLIDFSRIEKKWQKKWDKEKAFEVKEIVGKSAKSKPKFYNLEMYSYPSGSGLHMGHALNYTIGDIYARLKRMQGYNVLYPTGSDSFGLPAENAAIKAKSHPKKFTESAIKNYVKQMHALGLSYDFSRMVVSHDPEYYKWDQWIFLKLLEKGLAYKKKAGVNWCKKCKTVLANEQVVNGKCWRHEDIDVEVKQLEQWFFGITEYADELYEGIDKLTGWPESIKKLQKNWIGKSHGVEVDFEILTESQVLDSGGESSNFEINGEPWPVFTTRADTLFGVTFLVVSAQHPSLMSLVTDKQKKQVQNFLKKVRSVSEKDAESLEKEGVFTGAYAKHPLTGKDIPIWVGNFVVADYGSGMVMAVPAHDTRDYDFAKKYDIPIKEVVKDENGKSDVRKSAFTRYGVLVNSEGFDGLKSGEAIEHIANALSMKKKGRKKVAFRLKDWLISRQRFWGCPIPIIYCDKCGAVPVPEKDLPVKLPDNIKFTNNENPLKKYSKFVNVKCPKCASPGARRETDTMDTFVDSSWYFLRYCDAHNKKKIFDSKKVNYWMPVDQYIGGKEHATGHLIYCRFFTKFLRDLGLLDKKISEPAVRLFNQGMIQAEDGRKMSKSYGNVINPDDIIDKYGADALRLFLVSVASPDKDIAWSNKGVEGSLKFVLRVIEFAKNFSKKKSKLSKLGESVLNRTIRDYGFDIENFNYNLGVIKLRELFSMLENEGGGKKDFEMFLKMFSVVCPHVCEEIWNKLGNKKFISLSDWPVYDKKKINDKLEQEYRNVDKTIEDIRHVMSLAGIKKPKVYVYTLPVEVKLYIKNRSKIKEASGAEIVEVYSVSDKKKYDPEHKSKKVRPGRPGIYLE